AAVWAGRSRAQRGLVTGLHHGVVDRQRQRRRLAHALSGLPGGTWVPPVWLHGGHFPLLRLLLAGGAVPQVFGVCPLVQTWRTSRPLASPSPRPAGDRAAGGQPARRTARPGCVIR